MIIIIFNLATITKQIETRANTFTNSFQQRATITKAIDGGFYIFWQSSGQIHDWDVFGQRFDKNHNKIGTETLINNSVKNGNQSQPSAAMLSS